MIWLNKLIEKYGNLFCFIFGFSLLVMGIIMFINENNEIQYFEIRYNKIVTYNPLSASVFGLVMMITSIKLKWFRKLYYLIKKYLQ